VLKNNAVPPGCGKTTRVPTAMLDARGLTAAAFLMLETAAAFAARCRRRTHASTLAKKPGAKTVGFRVRVASAISKATRIEVVTEAACLTRMLHRTTPTWPR